MHQRVSLATYLAARATLVYDAVCYRQWMRSERERADHYRGHLKNTQRQLAMLRMANRLPCPEAMSW
jgi:hypothetical protein